MDSQQIHLFDRIVRYELDELSEEATIALFQELVDSGLAWRLQGSYGRVAEALIEAGYVTKPSTESEG
jgi:hypothetical protein